MNNFISAPTSGLELAIGCDVSAELFAGLAALFNTFEMMVAPHSLPPDSAMALAELITDGKRWKIVSRPTHRFALVRGPMQVAEPPTLLTVDLAVATELDLPPLPANVLHELQGLASAYRLRVAPTGGRA